MFNRPAVDGQVDVFSSRQSMRRRIECVQGIVLFGERFNVVFPAKAVALPAMQKKYFFGAMTPLVGLNGHAFKLKAAFPGRVEKFAVMVPDGGRQRRAKQVEAFASRD